jgi:CheY-like chemotaxis protein
MSFDFDPAYSVVIVDPAEAMGPVLKRMLSEIGIGQIDVLNNPIDAVARLNQGPTHLLIFDWVAEPVGGADFLRMVRADTGAASVPTMVVTADPRPDPFLEASEAGISGYAIAPFSLATLKQKVSVLAAHA